MPMTLDRNSHTSIDNTATCPSFIAAANIVSANDLEQRRVISKARLLDGGLNPE